MRNEFHQSAQKPDFGGNVGMNRLQKKCVIATAGIHLLLLTILLVGPAFFNARPKPDNTTVLTMIPANLIEAEFNSGVKNATPPPPTPPAPQPPQPQPPQVPPAPTPAPPKPEDTTPTIVTEIKRIFTPVPKPEPTPEKVSKPVKNASHEIKPDLTPVVRLTTPKVSKAESTRNNSAALKALKNLRKDLSSATRIDMPGNSSVAYANYASVVRSVYDAAWILPDTIARDENITVSVTIASDGTVVSSHIVSRSGDGPADDSVQRTLDRVNFVAPFPDGVTDKQKTFTITFNPQVKQSE